MTIYQTTQLCGDNLEVKFRRDQTYLFCEIDGKLTMEAKHILALIAALKAFEAAEAQAVYKASFPQVAPPAFPEDAP